MSGASNISCSCSISSIMRSTSIPSQYLTKNTGASISSGIPKDRDCAISSRSASDHLPQVPQPKGKVQAVIERELYE
jgi:hypothetical protein